MVLKETIGKMVAQGLSAFPHLFLVDVVGGDGPNSFRFLVDGDNGVGIHDCAELSRSVSKMIDESELSEEAFTFEISSPGADRPLLLARQYPKHVGRTFEVRMKDGKTITGILKAVNGNTISIEEKPEKKLKKGEEAKSHDIDLDTVEQSRIIITFK